MPQQKEDAAKERGLKPIGICCFGRCRQGVLHLRVELFFNLEGASAVSADCDHDAAMLSKRSARQVPFKISWRRVSKWQKTIHLILKLGQPELF